jgi:hypothetical protein
LKTVTKQQFSNINTMHDFFNVNLFQQIVSGLVVLVVSILLGNRTAKSKVIGKGWKITVIIAWCMILGGLYIIGLNTPNGGIYNPYVGMGLSITILGLLLKYVGKFFIWWHH